MDQESFRKLLSSGGATSRTSTTSRGSLLAPAAAAKKAKTADSSQTAFKPRKAKGPADSRYRDRAAERRVGAEHEFSHVEALLEDFEKKHEGEDDLVAKRAYLGGDASHSVLVQGLDFALLEQNKAKVAHEEGAKDDDELEATFRELETTLEQVDDGAAKGETGKKKSRADVLRALKEARAKETGAQGANADAVDREAEARKLEEKKQMGKFKPIGAGAGFKPVGSAGDEKAKRRKKDREGADGGERKKKRKIDSAAAASIPAGADAGPSRSSQPGASSAPASASKSAPAQMQPEPVVEDDDDIFAGAGEYEGLKLDDDDDKDGAEDAMASPPAVRDEPDESPEPANDDSARKKGWFDDDEPEPVPPSPPAPAAKGKEREKEQAEAEDGEDRPLRLAPLASSTIPSIKDILAMDEAAAKEEKRRARREKKKGKKKDGDDSE